MSNLQKHPMVVKPGDLSLAQVHVYLKQHGWHQAENPNPNAVVFEGPLDIYGRPITVILPARKTQIDARRRLEDVVRSLANIEEKSPERVTTEILRLATRPTRRRKPLSNAVMTS